MLRTRPRLWGVGAAVATTTLVVATVGCIGLRHPMTLRGAISGVSSGSAALSAPRAFRVFGHVTRLYPGRRVRMKVSVRNLRAFAIRVTKIVAQVRSRAQGCSGRDVRVAPYRRSFRVRAGALRTVRMRTRMLRTAPDACQGVRFSLRFKGRAVRA